MLGKARDQFGRRFGERATGIVLEVPLDRNDIAQKRLERLIVIDQTLVQEPGAPVIQDPADVKDDGRGPAHGQPWRALKRRLVLLMT